MKAKITDVSTRDSFYKDYEVLIGATGTYKSGNDWGDGFIDA